MIKKSDYDTKIAETESKYVSNTGFDSKLAQAKVITKRNFNAKIVELEDNVKKLQTFNSSYFREKLFLRRRYTKLFIFSTNNQIF